MTFRKRALLWWWIILIAVLAGIWPAGYFYSLTEPAELRPTPPVCRPDGTAELGGQVIVSTVCDLPLWSPPPTMTVTPPENMVAAGAPRVRGAWRWCRKRWRLEAILRPIRPGAASGGKLEIASSNLRNSVCTLAVGDIGRTGSGNAESGDVGNFHFVFRSDFPSGLDQLREDIIGISIFIFDPAAAEDLAVGGNQTDADFSTADIETQHDFILHKKNISCL